MVSPEISRGVEVMSYQAIARQAGEELAEKYQRVHLRERAMAVLEPTLQGRTAFISETRPGTVIGEIMRSGAMLKSFPTSYMMLILGRFYDELQAGNMGRPNTIVAAASIFVVGTLLGALVRQAKSITQGRDAEDMTNPDFWAKSFTPGLDFETRILYKPDAAALLERELAARNYRVSPIALGVNTDAYQPAERRLGITRALLEVLAACRHPLTVVTKSALIERDIDLLADLARDGLVHVMFSVTTLDAALARRMEPRAAAPARWLAAMRRLHEAGIAVGVLVAPLIPALTDRESDAILAASRAAGARSAAYILLRLPLEVKPVFEAWLERQSPWNGTHVMSLMRQMHGGKEYESAFGASMRGRGVFADVISRRFALAARRLGLDAPGPGMLPVELRETLAARCRGCGEYGDPAAA